MAAKSGKNPEGNLINRLSKCIWIFDCVSTFGQGMTIGSELFGELKM